MAELLLEGQKAIVWVGERVKLPWFFWHGVRSLQVKPLPCGTCEGPASPVLKGGMQRPLVLRAPSTQASWWAIRLAPCLCMSSPLVLSQPRKYLVLLWLSHLGSAFWRGVTCLTIAIQIQLPKSFAFCLNLALLKFCQGTGNNLKLDALDVNSLVNWHKSYLGAQWSSFKDKKSKIFLRVGGD